MPTGGGDAVRTDQDDLRAVFRGQLTGCGEAFFGLFRTIETDEDRTWRTWRHRRFGARLYEDRDSCAADDLVGDAAEQVRAGTHLAHETRGQWRRQ